MFWERTTYGISSYLIIVGNYFTGMSWADVAAFLGIAFAVCTLCINVYFQHVRTKKYLKTLDNWNDKNKVGVPLDRED